MKNILRSFVIIVILTSCGSNQDKTQSDPVVNSENSSDSVPLKENNISNTPIDTIHYGIDIPHYQGDILNLIPKQDSIKFVICKATEGLYYIDPKFQSNWNTIKEKGLIRGAYHFYQCNEDPTKQAQHFCAQLSGLDNMDIAPVLDIEQGSMSSGISGEIMQNDILIFLKTVAQLTDRKPILYTDYSFAQEYLNNPELQQYDLWLAEYSGNQQPKTPNLWKEKGFKIWQKSAHYSVSGYISDLDIYYGPLSKLVE